MRKVLSDCQGCAKEKGCKGKRCPYYSLVVYECDRCKDEMEWDEVFLYKGKHYCAGCILMVLQKDGVIAPVPEE